MKKLLSLVAAAAMAFSMLSPVASTVLAEEATPEQASAEVATGENAGEETPLEKVAAMFDAALPTMAEVEAMSAEDASNLMDESEEIAAAIDAYYELSDEDFAAFEIQYPDQYAVMMALAAKAAGDAAFYSTQPMPYTSGIYVTLSGRSKTELQNFPVKEFLSLMKTYDGQDVETIEPVEGATYAEFYFTRDERDVVKVPVTDDSTIDLWEYANYENSEDAYTSYQLEMVLNNGKQLDTDNSHRYAITVELCTEGVFSRYLYPYVERTKLDGSIYAGSPDICTVKDSEIFDTIGIPGQILDFYVEGTIDAVKLFGSTSDELTRNGITAKAYAMSDYLAHGADVINQCDEIDLKNGDSFSAEDVKNDITAENYQDAPNLLCLVYLNESGRILGYLGVGVVGHAVDEELDGGDIELTLWSYENGKMVQAGTGKKYGSDDDIWYYIDAKNTDATGVHVESRSTSNVWYMCSVTLNPGYKADQEYYLTMSGSSVKSVKNCDTGEDLTQTLFCDTTGTAPFGYKANYDYSNYSWNLPGFVLENKYEGTKNIRVYASESSDPYYSSTTTYFRIQGAYDADGHYLDTEAPRLLNMPLDTYYSYDSQYEVGGYQVLLINDEVEDLKKIKPIFDLGSGAVAQSGSAVATSGVTDLQNFTWLDLDGDTVDDTVIYNVHIPGNKVQNYMVTFVTKQQEKAKLFVPGPEERYVVLNEDSNDRHDIMIANVGDQDLTGLSVRLEDPQNVKLDDYWVVGGEKNDTLTGFTKTYPYYTDEEGTEHYSGSGYETLACIAKIRLLKDGIGDVSGTLVISSANGGERRIKLTGVAGKPQLLDAAPTPAVKFVHYSYMLSTNNMYRDNTVTFSITDGALPEGVSLYENTGEIYGVPQEAGVFQFTVKAHNSMTGFGDSYATYVLNVRDNTNANVYLSSDIEDGYDIQVPLGVEQGAGSYDFLITNPDEDQLYVSNGVIEEMSKTSINGQDLKDISDQLDFAPADISYVSGSTRLTISGQAFRKMINAGVIYTDTPNTISMEFRVGGVETNEMKRTAQNFRVDDSAKNTSGGADNSNGSAGSTGSNASAGANGTDAAAAGSGAEAQYLKSLRVRVLDANGAPQPGMTVQLHSTVHTGVTGSDGSITFYNVEFGKHNLTIKNASGDVLATKDFTISAGTVATAADSVTAPGGSDLSIDVKLDGNGGMAFNDMPSGTAKAPSTGDGFNPVLWSALLCLSGLALAGLMIRRKREQ